MMTTTPRQHPYRHAHVLVGGLQHTVGGLTRRLHLAADGLSMGREKPLDASRLLARADAFAQSLDEANPMLDRARERMREALRGVLRAL
ncbi:MAG: hypothetical protein H6722_03670 [Sandaracinus sp.]|nr:hypothetical protein [Sandaracinus sp.]